MSQLIVSTLVISSLIFNIFNPYETLAQTGVVYYEDIGDNGGAVSAFPQ